MSKPKKETASGNEKFLKNVGEAQIGATQMFEGAHQAVLREAQADHSERLRGRSAGETWAQLGGGLDANSLAQGNSTRHDKYADLATSGLGGSMREGTKRATELSDALGQEGAGARLSNVEISGKNLQKSARQEDAVSSAKTQAANAWKNELMNAGVTLASAGLSAAAGSYQDGKEMGSKPETFDPSGLGAAGGEKKNWFYKKGYSSGYDKWLNSMPGGG